MRHFLYKSRSSAQFTSPTYAPCYNLPENKKRLNSVYLNIQNRFLSTSQPLKLVHHTSKYEIVLGWLTQSFELYATFAPMTSKLKVITAVNKLLRWIKKEEDKMFILSAPTFWRWKSIMMQSELWYYSVIYDLDYYIDSICCLTLCTQLQRECEHPNDAKIRWVVRRIPRYILMNEECSNGSWWKVCEVT